MENYVFKVNPVIDHSVRGLCCKPYQGHPKGCPNFNKKMGCPPSVALFDDVYDMSKPMYAVVNKFDFAGHISRMKQLHPEWSERQLKCCLYWQRGARAELKKRIELFSQEYGSDYRVEVCPEAMGVNVTETMRQAGIELQWPPETVVHQIALAAVIKSE